jgi:hypothetical protein
MVRLSSSVLRSELSMAKDNILAKINQRFGSNRVKDLIFI